MVITKGYQGTSNSLKLHFILLLRFPGDSVVANDCTRHLSDVRPLEITFGGRIKPGKTGKTIKEKVK
jgi:hypothetical protein